MSDAGCQAAPAFSCDEALARIRQIGGDVNAAIINPSLRGASGLLEILRKDHADLRIVAIREPGEELPATISAHATLEKPREPALSREEWVHKVKQALADGFGEQLS